MIIKQDIKGVDYLNLALLAFLGLGLELVLVFLEPFVYGQAVELATWTIITHWIMTCIVWGGAIVLILNYATKRYDFRLKDSDSKMKLWQWVAVAALVALSVFMSYQSWDGFKVQKEFMKLGIIKFIFQYTYYFFETGLFTLIIVFGQKAFEKWLKNKNIPYGGIICGLTWGLAHIFTKSSIDVGILSAISGFGFGAVYLLLNRDLKKTFPIIFFMFAL